MLFSLLLLSVTACAQVPENLDEMFARKARMADATWPVDSLEDSGNHYIWQPETLMYDDVQTGHEVWRMSNTPGSNNF